MAARGGRAPGALHTSSGPCLVTRPGCIAATIAKARDSAPRPRPVPRRCWFLRRQLGCQTIVSRPGHARIAHVLSTATRATERPCQPWRHRALESRKVRVLKDCHAAGLQALKRRSSLQSLGSSLGSIVELVSPSRCVSVQRGHSEPIYGGGVIRSTEQMKMRVL